MKALNAVCQSFHVVTVHSDTALFVLKLTAATIISLLMEEGVLNWECSSATKVLLMEARYSGVAEFRICDFELN